MTLLAQQICRNHPLREAVARCVECANFFCRECIAEHEGRLVCAGCLAKLTHVAPRRERTWPRTLRSLATGLLGFICAWICFYAVGRLLLTLPSEFHARKWWSDTVQRFQSDEE